MEFEGKWATFYKKCLSVLETREGFNDSYVPLLERYVFVTQKMSVVADEMAIAETTIKQTNTQNHTNEVSNPMMRIFVLLNKESLALAKELQLTPASLKAKLQPAKEKPKGFVLDNKMKAA